MARQPRITRGIQARLASTGLWTAPLAFIAEGETLDRVRCHVRFFYDPELSTVTSNALAYGFGWGLYVDPDVVPASPLDPFNDVNADWQWHQYDQVTYETPGGNVLVHGPRDTEAIDARAKRGPAPVDGMWLQAAMQVPSFITDGWTGSVGFAAVILEV
jgi:hypothetical protein